MADFWVVGCKSVNVVTVLELVHNDLCTVQCNLDELITCNRPHSSNVILSSNSFKKVSVVPKAISSKLNYATNEMTHR